MEGKRRREGGRTEVLREGGRDSVIYLPDIQLIQILQIYNS